MTDLQYTTTFDRFEREKLCNLLECSSDELDNNPNIEFSVSFDDLPTLGLQNARLIRDVELQNTIQQILIPQYEQAKLEETKNIPTLQVIDKPKVALNKAKPKRAFIVIGATLMGFILSLIYLYTDKNTQSLRNLIKEH